MTNSTTISSSVPVPASQTQGNAAQRTGLPRRDRSAIWIHSR
jgi:hypothetical protein